MNPNNPTIRAALKRKQTKMCERIAEYYNLSLDAVCPEFLEVFQIVADGAKKYELNGWLKEDGTKASFKEMHDSMFHHLADSYAGKRQDKDSGRDPLLQLGCRALMEYTLIQRKIIHDKDKI